MIIELKLKYLLLLCASELVMCHAENMLARVLRQVIQSPTSTTPTPDFNSFENNVDTSQTDSLWNPLKWFQPRSGIPYNPDTDLTTVSKCIYSLLYIAKSNKNKKKPFYM